MLDYAEALAKRETEYAKAAQKFRKEKGYFNQAEFEQVFDAENKPLFADEVTPLPETIARPTDSQYTEGMTATNPTTGEKLVFTNGQWVAM